MRKILQTIAALIGMGLLVYFLFWGLPSIHTKFFTESQPVAKRQPARKFTEHAGNIRLGDKWVGCYKPSWIIMPFASDENTITILEGNPEVGIFPKIHKAPGAFRSGCTYVKVIPGDGLGDWVVKIYTRPSD